MQEARALRQFNRLWLARVTMQVVAAVWLVSEVLGSGKSLGMLDSTLARIAPPAMISSCNRTEPCTKLQHPYTCECLTS